MKKFRILPQSLKVMFAGLALAPISFALYAVATLDVVAQFPAWYLWLTLGCYGLVPGVLAVGLLLRHASFLYLLIAECVGLLTLAFLQPRALPTFVFSLHYALVMAMVIMALMLVNKDILFPFVLPGFRGFRTAPRLPINQRVRLVAPRLAQELEMMVEDYSLGGLSLYASEDSADPVVARLARYETVTIVVNVARGTFQVPMELKWQSRLSSLVRLGLKAKDEKAMAELFGALTARRQAPGLADRWQSAWARRSVRRLVNMVFAVGLLSLLIFPPVVQGDALRTLRKEASAAFERARAGAGKIASPAPASGKKTQKIGH
jgi:hypothetical protein